MEVHDHRVARPRSPRPGRIRAVSTLTELLMADHPSPCPKERETGDCELEGLARRLEIGAPRFAPRVARPRDDSSLVIAVDHDSCILCDRCVRGCGEIRDNQVIGRAGKGETTRIAFDLDVPMGRSSCVSCGECMVSCPTGALTHRGIVNLEWKGDGPEGRAVEADELIGHAVPDIRAAFSGISRPFLQWNARSVVRRRFRAGEVVCREGTEGSTAFLIESGTVEVFIRPPGAQVDERRSSVFGLLQRFVRRGDRDGDDGGRRFVPVEGLLSLPIGNPRATMTTGDLFGEMSCINATKRSATVRAATDCSLPGDAAQRAGHHAAEPVIPPRRRAEVPRAGHRRPSVERLALRRPPA